MATMEEAKRMKEKYESLLLKKKGVVGCATGYKKIKGRKTDKYHPERPGRDTH
jgi:hypothetical protein